MAGDWIKMRNNLWDDPRVSSICDMTNQGEAAVVGGLYWLWSSADEHTEDGFMPGLSVAGIDRKTGIKGFGAALVAIGWIEDTEGGITIVRFDEHNGSSAKRRCTDAQRKATFRNLSATEADSIRTATDENETCCGAREEKRREVNNTSATPDGFADFWAAYPKKKNKGDAEKSWKKLRPSAELLQTMLAAIAVARCQPDWLKDGGQYIPYPASWLNAKGWEDSFPANVQPIKKQVAL